MNTNFSANNAFNPTVIHLSWMTNVVIIALIIAFVYFFVWKKKK